MTGSGARTYDMSATSGDLILTGYGGASIWFGDDFTLTYSEDDKRIIYSS